MPQVFVQKRKPLDMAAARTADLDLDNVEVEEKREVLVAANRNKQKWKKESSSFRDSLRAAREYGRTFERGEVI